MDRVKRLIKIIRIVAKQRETTNMYENFRNKLPRIPTNTNLPCLLTLLKYRFRIFIYIYVLYMYIISETESFTLLEYIMSQK